MNLYKSINTFYYYIEIRELSVGTHKSIDFKHRFSTNNRRG